MFRLAVFGFALVFGLLSFSPAQARFKFGADDEIHFIQDVKATGPKGEKLYLGYKTRMEFFLLGLYVEDNGYVLGVTGDSKRYFHMPVGAELDRLQRQGLLPRPLPHYSLSALNYLVGYSLWLAIAFVALWSGFSWWRKRRAKKTAISA